MKYGMDLIKELEQQIERDRKIIRDRIDRINACETDWDDCFMSQRCDERNIALANDKIDLLGGDGCAWFNEYATLDGQLVEAHWFKNQYNGYTLRAVMPDGRVVFTSAHTAKGLEKKGLKQVLVRRPAWFQFRSSGSGMLGVYTGEYVLVPSDINYATGRPASEYPVEVKDL